MNAKFHMTQEENIFVAKRNIVDYIYKSARLEGLRVTYPDTEAIYNGGVVNGLRIDEIIAVNNLKHAWMFLMGNIELPMSYAFIMELHKLVGANLINGVGFIRSIPISIGGTSWKPDFLVEVDIKEEIWNILQIESPTERAITFMLNTMRRQMFLDGNKRVSMLAANQIMISNGAGVISVPVEKIDTFSTLLIDYYETNHIDYMKQFVYDQCIDGLDMETERNAQNGLIAKYDEVLDSVDIDFFGP